jgi:ACS family tartrate transporter-like MFS transporter
VVFVTGAGVTTADQVFARCERRLVPFIGLLYLVSIVDRLNVGFAGLTMNKDLDFSNSVFGLGAGIFFAGYLMFQVPANLVMERLGARRWIFIIVLSWALVSSACAFVQGPISFYVLRFILGVAEAGLFPGMVLYFTYWFPQSYQARLTGGFMAASPFAFIVGGPISTSILGLEGVAGLHGWQWLFLIEGAPAFLRAFAVLRLLPDNPRDAAWLTAEEKSLAAARLAAEPKPESRKFWPAFRDARVWALGIAYMAVGAGGYGMRLWLPQIVQGMGFSTFATGFVVAVPYALAMAAMIWWGRSSDAKRERIWHVVLPMLLGAAGFLAASLSQSNAVMLLAITAVIIGLDAVIGPFWSLPSSFLRGSAAAAGIALINTLGVGIGGLLGPPLIGVLKDATGGYAASMAVLALALVLSGFIILGFAKMRERVFTARSETPASTH